MKITVYQNPHTNWIGPNRVLSRYSHDLSMSTFSEDGKIWFVPSWESQSYLDKCLSKVIETNDYAKI